MGHHTVGGRAGKIYNEHVHGQGLLMHTRLLCTWTCSGVRGGVSFQSSWCVTSGRCFVSVDLMCLSGRCFVSTWIDLLVRKLVGWVGNRICIPRPTNASLFPACSLGRIDRVGFAMFSGGIWHSFWWNDSQVFHLLLICIFWAPFVAMVRWPRHGAILFHNSMFCIPQMFDFGAISIPSWDARVIFL